MTRRLWLVGSLLCLQVGPSIAQAQGVALHFGELHVSAAPGAGLRADSPTLPVISLGPGIDPNVDRAFTISDSAVRRPAGSGLSGLEYRLAAPAVATFSSSPSGGRRLSLDAPVVLATPDGRGSAVYEVEVRADVPTARTRVHFPVTVIAWRQGADGSREVAFRGELKGWLVEE